MIVHYETADGLESDSLMADTDDPPPFIDRACRPEVRITFASKKQRDMISPIRRYILGMRRMNYGKLTECWYKEAEAATLTDEEIVEAATRLGMVKAPPVAVQAGEQEALNQIHGIAKQAFYRQGGESMRLIMQLAENPAGAAVQTRDAREAVNARQILIQEARKHGRSYWGARKGDYGHPWPLIYKERRFACLRALSFLKAAEADSAHVDANPGAQPPALKALVEGLKDALEGLVDMFPYVPEYFQKKWGHQGYIDRAQAALTPYLDSAQPKPNHGEAPFAEGEPS